MKVDKLELKNAIPYQQFYSEHLGQPVAPIAGGHKYFCKFHNDQKTPNLVVLESGRFKCFACGASGDVFDFHQKFTGESFSKTLNTLSQKYGHNLLNGNGSGNGTKTANGLDKRKIVATYQYKDEEGRLLYEAVRFDPKSFSYRQPNDNGGWDWKLNGSRRVPYRLPELIASDGPIYIPGGEKDCDNLVKHGLTATTNVCGEGNWKEEYNGYLKGRDVFILEDNDDPGKKHGRVISESLQGIAKSIKIVRFPELLKGGDVSDFLLTHSIDDLKNKVEQTSFYTQSKEQVKSLPDEQNKTQKSWPVPDQIKTELSSIEPLPLEILPEPFKLWIEDISYRMQCPPDFVATAAIVLAGSLIGTRCGIHPKQNDDWLVIPNIWGGVVGRPSTLKTPAISEALKPLSRLEAEAKKKHDEEIKKHEMDSLEFHARHDSLKAEMKRAAGGAGKKSMESIKNDLFNLEKPASPILTRYKTNDATVEKLSELLNESPSGLLMFRDELVGLLSTWEKPGRESDRAFFLEAWNGDGGHTTDRIGRGTIFTKNLCLSLFGGIQPTKLTSYLYQSMNGLDNDGLIQRLQLLVFPDEIKNWKLIDQRPDREAKGRAFKVIQRLSDMDMTEFGLIREGEDEIPYLKFSDSAQEVFNEWLVDLELNKLRNDDHPMIIEHLGKYRSLMPSLALIFHLIGIANGDSSGPVSLQATEKAAAWCDYLESHARRIYGLVLDIDQQAAEIFAEKIKAGKLKDGFTVRDVYRKGWHLLNDKKLAQSACDEHVDAGWLKVEYPDNEGVGRKALPVYRINPKLKNEEDFLENNTD